ncbi:MAG TPA: hypothetical protein VHM48_09345, partial [Candidatus Limnocylindrales bacterium]|nr:hypothetical protein [Candidatus Limnocylindrales bacterium]
SRRTAADGPSNDPDRWSCWSVGGAAIASGHLWIGALSDCAVSGGPTDQQLQRSGSFDGPSAAVRLDLTCGSLTVATSTGANWALDAAYRGPAPIVDSSSSRLDLRVSGGGSARRNDWTISLPSAVGVLSITANAATATLQFPDGHVASLDVDMNAGDLRIDATHGAVDVVDLSMNAGRIRLDAGSSVLGGDVSVNAGAFDLCVPDGVGLRLEVTNQLTFVHNLAARGLSRSGDTWTRPAAAGAPIVTLSIDGGAASFSLNPVGGCR